MDQHSVWQQINGIVQPDKSSDADLVVPASEVMVEYVMLNIGSIAIYVS